MQKRSPRFTTSGGNELEVVPRREFVRRFGKDYRPSHVTKLGPTQRGKSTLSFQCLRPVISPDFQAIVLHGKIAGRDPVIPKAAEALNLRIIDRWPPPPSWRIKDRPRNVHGYILLPLTRPQDSVEAENVLLRAEFSKAAHHAYSQESTPIITHVDESHQAQETLRMKKQLEGPLMRGLPVNPEWNNIQRGRFVSYHCYDAAEHLFIFYDPDLSNQRRYSEIGGVDPHEIIDITSNLRTESVPSGGTISQALYIRRAGPYMCIVDT